MASRWLFFISRKPSEPARKRVTIWRDLKCSGALYLQQFLCLAAHQYAG